MVVELITEPLLMPTEGGPTEPSYPGFLPRQLHHQSPPQVIARIA